MKIRVRGSKRSALQDPLTARQCEDIVVDMQQQGYTPDTALYNSLMHVYAQNGDVLGSRNVFNRMPVTAPPSVVTFATLMNAHIVQGDVKSAEDVLIELDSFQLQPDLCMMNTLMNGYAKCGNFSQAERIMGRLSELNLQPSRVSFNVICYAYAKANKVDQAQGIMRLREETGIELDVKTVTILLFLYAANSMVEEAEELFESWSNPTEWVYGV